jgi:hypothetical protein
MRFRHRRIVEQVRLTVGDESLPRLRARVDPFQHRRRGETLERAAHRKALVRAMKELSGASRVDDGDAKPAAGAPFQGGDPVAWHGRVSLTRCHGGKT